MPGWLEMADDEQKILLEARRLPLPDRVGHKNWRVRSEAWEDVRARCERAFSSSDPILDEAGEMQCIVCSRYDVSGNTFIPLLSHLHVFLAAVLAFFVNFSMFACSFCR